MAFTDSLSRNADPMADVGLDSVANPLTNARRTAAPAGFAPMGRRPRQNGMWGQRPQRAPGAGMRTDPAMGPAVDTMAGNASGLLSPGADASTLAPSTQAYMRNTGLGDVQLLTPGKTYANPPPAPTEVPPYVLPPRDVFPDPIIRQGPTPVSDPPDAFGRPVSGPVADPSAWDMRDTTGHTFATFYGPQLQAIMDKYQGELTSGDPARRQAAFEAMAKERDAMKASITSRGGGGEIPPPNLNRNGTPGGAIQFKDGGRVGRRKKRRSDYVAINEVGLDMGKTDGAGAGAASPVTAFAAGGRAKGGAGSPAPAANPWDDWQALSYNESMGPIEQLMMARSAGRPFYGTRRIDNYDDPSLYARESVATGGDDGGYRTQYTAVDPSLMGSVSPGTSAGGEIFFRGPNGRAYTRVPMVRTDNQSGITAWDLGQDYRTAQQFGISASEWGSWSPQERERMLRSINVQPDRMHGMGDMVYSPRDGWLTPADTIRDPDARRNGLIDAAMAAAVGGAAAYGIAGGAGLTPGGEFGPVDPTGGGGGGIGLETAGETPFNLGESPGVQPGVEAETGLTTPPEPGTPAYQQVAQNPQVQSLAQRAGQTVGQYLSNPSNWNTIARVAGLAISAFGGGSRGPVAQGVPDPSTGGGTGGTGGTGIADASYLDVLNPDKFVSGNANVDRYEAVRGQFKPISDLLISEAQKVGTEAEQERAAGIAGADAAQATQQARERAAAEALANGFKPGEGDASRLIDFQGDLMSVGAKNAARRAEKDRRLGALSGVASFGLNDANVALGADREMNANDLNNRRLAADVATRRADLTLRDRLGTEQNAISRARVNADIALGNRSAAQQDRVNTGRGIAGIIGLGGDLYRGWSGSGGSSGLGYGTADPSVLGDGLPYKDGGRACKPTRVRFRKGGRVMGKEKCYDEGGPVCGPGTGTSDSIRARLSDGEHVLNAEAVELLDATQPGVLDALNDQGLAIRKVRESLDAQMKNIGLGD